MRESKAIKFNGKSYPVSYNALIVTEMEEKGINISALMDESKVLSGMYKISYYGVKGGHLAKRKDFDMSFEDFCLDLASDTAACIECSKLFSAEYEKVGNALNTQLEQEPEKEEAEKKPKRRTKATSTQAKP